MTLKCNTYQCFIAHSFHFRPLDVIADDERMLNAWYTVSCFGERDKSKLLELFWSTERNKISKITVMICYAREQHKFFFKNMHTIATEYMQTQEYNSWRILHSLNENWASIAVYYTAYTGLDYLSLVFEI